jgi:exopolyphosphatase/guanosine-5'-triphosphate,3'-diphosphate pyrophosphatase
MREAENGKEILAKIKEHTGVNIDIISGKEEAEFLFMTENLENIEEGKKYLSIDLGGGSIEFNLFTNKEIIISKSFNIGTIRMLNNKVPEYTIYELKKWLKTTINKHQIYKLIGSGGNINKLFRISETSKGEPLEYKKLKNLYKYLDSFNYDDRIKILQLNIDRADVIMPAAQIFIKIMKWTSMKEIIVPVIGLSDGIVRQVYNNYINKKTNGKKLDSKTKS